MSMEAFQGKTQDELRDLLGYMKKELFNLRFQKATGELANTSRFRQVKRDVARVNTALGKLKKDAA
jgi:large subunit ribosomal protein L29